MLKNQRKLILLIYLFLVVPFLFGCFLDVKRMVEIASDNQGLLPVQRFSFTIKRNQRDQLFDQFHKFAKKHDFEIEISDYGTGGDIFQIWMLRDNIKIIANDIPDTQTGVTVKFYDQSRATPMPDETMDIINKLALDLESFIMEIPTVTITDRR